MKHNEICGWKTCDIKYRNESKMNIMDGEIYVKNIWNMDNYIES